MALLHRRHDFGIDNDTLWSIVEKDTPALLGQLIALKQQLG
jgi:hypothetical protein